MAESGSGNSECTLKTYDISNKPDQIRDQLTQSLNGIINVGQKIAIGFKNHTDVSGTPDNITILPRFQ